MLSTIERSSLLTLNIDRYDEMIRTGTIREGAPFELIDGLLVIKDRSARGEDLISIADEHAWCVERLRDLNEIIRPRGAHVRSQQPVRIEPDSKPEPDCSIVRGSNDDYRSRGVSAADVSCLIEVADSSLKYDRSVKRALYEAARVRQYLIINLVDRQIEEFQPRFEGSVEFGLPRIFVRDESIAIRLPDGSSIQVNATTLLP